MARRRRAKGRDLLTTVLIFGLLVAAIVWLDGSNRQNFSGSAYAVDGDSLQMDGKRLRIFGIDAPELGQSCGSPGSQWSCGREARAFLRRLLSADLVCETTGLDRYDRHLVRCNASNNDIGAAMVEAGMAVSYGAYGREEAEAKAAKRGLWRDTFTHPQQWREANGDRDEETGAVLRNWFDRLRQWRHTVVNQILNGEG